MPEFDADFVRSVIERLTYKATWRFTFAAHDNRPYVQATTSNEPDSRTGADHPEFIRWWPIYYWPPQDALVTEAQVVAWVRHAVQEWEVHDVNEWLRLDGEIIHDPHECSQCLIGGCRA